jgi:hypothetical protein
MEKFSSGLNNLRHRMRTPLRLAAILLCVTLMVAPRAVFAATFTASLDNDSVILSESATLSLTIEGGSLSQDPALPFVDGLRIVYIGPSQQVSFINGQVNSKTTYNYSVTAQRAGKFEIPAINVTANSQKLASQPLKLTVAKPGAPSSEAINSGAQLVFMKLALPKKEIYAGEVFTAELDVYVRDSVQNIGNFQLTALPSDGFTTGKRSEGQQRREQVGNAVYNVIPIMMTMTALKPGDFAIGPITASIVVELPVANNRRSRDPFGDMPDPFGMLRRVERHQLSLATDAMPVQSRPLPTQNVPSGFNGAVGKFTMTVSAGPTNIAVGDPITVRVQISGRGALDTVAWQPQAAGQDFKVYPPTLKVETTDTLGLEGTKTFEEIVVPQNPDVRELPPISFSFFDPEAKEYRTLTQPATQLAIRSSGASVTPTLLASKTPTDNTPPPAQDIVTIKQRLGTVQQIGPALVQQKWFLAMQGVPVLAWIATLVWRRQKDSLANNPRLRRQREVARVIQNGLLDLQQLARENKSDDFFAGLFRLLQERLGERLDLPASAITEAVIDERLRPGGVEETTLQRVHELFQLCNQTRYAPVRSSQELAAVIPKLEAVLGELQNLKA